MAACRHDSRTYLAWSNSLTRTLRELGLKGAADKPPALQDYLAARSAGYGAYVAPLLIAGIGISMALPCVSAAGLNAVSPSSLGKAAGVLNTMQQFGAVFGIAVGATVFNAHGSLASAAAVTSGYRPALAVAATLSFLGAITALALRRPRPAGRAP